MVFKSLLILSSCSHLLKLFKLAQFFLLSYSLILLSLFFFFFFSCLLFVALLLLPTHLIFLSCSLSLSLSLPPSFVTLFLSDHSALLLFLDSLLFHLLILFSRCSWHSLAFDITVFDNFKHLLYASRLHLQSETCWFCLIRNRTQIKPIWIILSLIVFLFLSLSLCLSFLSSLKRFFFSVLLVFLRAEKLLTKDLERRLYEEKIIDFKNYLVSFFSFFCKCLFIGWCYILIAFFFSFLFFF